jgi:preprotein translocase subunit SecA
VVWVLGSREAIAEHLRELVDARLEAREAEVGEEAWTVVERLVLLRTIDSLWVEHLTELDDLRRGIGLRGYAQQDPLNEFRREAFRMYQELRDLIRHGVATTIFRVTVNRQAPPTGDGSIRPPGAAGAADGDGQGQPTGIPATAAAPATVGAVGLPGAATARRMQEQLGDRPVGSGAPSAGDGGARPGHTPSGERIGRNDPCWCGSGQKYKKCHGR